MAIPTHLLKVARGTDPGPTDGELLRRYAAGRDEAAFAEVVRRNGPIVLRACRSVLGEAATAEDAFQAVFLLLARNAGRLTRPGSLAGWLHAAAVQTARAARRAEDRRRRREARPARPIAVAPADELTWREVRAVLDAELAALPERYRVPLVLCYLQELTYAEAARLAGCPVGALRGRLERGKAVLRRRLARHGLPLAAPVLVLGRPPVVGAALIETAVGTARAWAAGGAVPPAVAELVPAAGRLATPLLASILTAATAFGVAAAVVVLPVGRPGAGSPPPGQPVQTSATDPAPRTDRFGDPLPEGAVMRLGTTRCRANITSFGVLPDGTVVTVGSNLEVRTWGPRDDASGDPVRLALADARASDYPQVSPDGNRVAAHSPVEIAVWERQAAGVRKVASFDIALTRRMLFSPDGTKLLVAHTTQRDELVTVCDIPSGTTRRLNGPTGAVECMAFSGDGQRAAVAASEGSRVLVWEAATGEPVAEFTPAGLRIRSLALNPTGDVLAAIPLSESSDIRFLDARTGAVVEGLTGPAGYGWVTYAPDGKTVLLGGRDGVQWWDPVAGKLIRRFEGSTTQGGRLTTPGRFTPDGKTLVASSPRILLRWDAATGEPRFAAQVAGHHNDVFTLGVSPDGKTIATGGYDDRVRTWDAAIGKPVHSFASLRPNIPNLDFSPDGKFLYGLGEGWGGPVKWDLTTGNQVFRFEIDPEMPRQTRPEALRLSTDGKTLAAVTSPYSAADPHVFTAWDADSGERRASTRLEGRQLLHFGIAISPDRRWLSAGGGLYPVQAGPAADMLPADAVRSGYFPGTFSPDSRLVAMTSNIRKDPERRWFTAVYEVATGAKVRELPPGSGGRVAFSPDGRSIAAAGAAGIGFWDLTTGKQYGGYKAPGEGMGFSPHSCANVLGYFPDGSKLVTGHADTTALVWEVPGRPKGAQPLDEKGWATAWDDLASADGARGWAAVWALADDPGAAAFLKARMTPRPPLPAKEFEKLLADLDAADFATRVAAAAKLEAERDRAAGRLRDAFRRDLSAEQRAAVGKLLGVWEATDRAVPTRDRLRVVRAVAALELGGTAEARKVLAELAAGPADAIATREAGRALERLAR